MEVPETCDAHGNPTPCAVCVTGALHELALQDQASKLKPIGREWALTKALARQIRREGVRGHAITELHETLDGRGFWFEVGISEDRKPTNRVARVRVTFERVEQWGDD